MYPLRQLSELRWTPQFQCNEILSLLVALIAVIGAAVPAIKNLLTPEVATFRFANLVH